MTSPYATVHALEAERARLQALVADLRRAHADVVAASESSNADDEHDPEGSTIAFERAQLSTQITHAQAGLDDIDQALSRVRTGDYGRCTRCGGAIAAARLEARPTATTCISCAAQTGSAR